MVYKISCGNCNVTYYKKTERHLHVISAEHFGVSHLTGKKVEWELYAVSDHLLPCDHGSDFIDFTIKFPDNNGFRLLLR